MPVYQYQVDMTCEGCSKRIDKKLSTLTGKGVEKFEIDLEKKLVTVNSSTLTSDEVKTEIEKTGKKATLLG